MYVSTHILLFIQLAFVLLDCGRCKINFTLSPYNGTSSGAHAWRPIESRNDIMRLYTPYDLCILNTSYVVSSSDKKVATRVQLAFKHCEKQKGFSTFETLRKFRVMQCQVNNLVGHVGGPCVNREPEVFLMQWNSPRNSNYPPMHTMYNALQKLGSLGVDTLLFYGDSIMEHTYQAAVCAAARSNPYSMRTNGINGMSKWGFHKRLQSMGIKGIHDRSHVTVIDMTPEFHMDLVFIKGMIPDRVLTKKIFSSLRRNESSPSPHTTGAIISNFDHHIWRFNLSFSVAEHMQLLDHFLEDLAIFGSETGHYAWWRESSAQHFVSVDAPDESAIATGLFQDVSVKSSNYSCTHAGNYTGAVRFIRAVEDKILNLTKHFNGSFLRILHFFDATFGRPDLQVGPRYVDQYDHLDCTHYCYTPALYENIWAEFYASLAR